MKKLLLDVLDNIKPSKEYEKEILDKANAIINKINKGIKFRGMTVVVEECNLFINEDSSKGASYYMTEILCRGFKYEMKIIANFQNIFGINENIIEHLTSGTNPILIGGLTSKDKKKLSEFIPEIRDLNLRSKDKLDYFKWGANEWALLLGNEFETFVPCPSLSMIHERG